jgi:hypothetical protein
LSFLCLLLKTWLRLPYRNVVSFLTESSYLWPIIGLKELTGRMDLQRAMIRLTKEYLSGLNTFIVEEGYYKKKREEEGEKEEKIGAPVILIVPASRT